VGDKLCFYTCIRQVSPVDVTARDGRGKTAVHYCAINSTSLVLQLVVSRDRSVVDTSDNAGHTPLHTAVIAGNMDVVRALLDHGANINAQDHDRHTAAHWAVGLYTIKSIIIIIIIT